MKKQNTISLPLHHKTVAWLGRSMMVIVDKDGKPLIEISPDKKKPQWQGIRLTRLLNRLGEEYENSKLLQSIFKEAGVVPAKHRRVPG